MFNKVKSFLGKVISKAENKIGTAKAVMTARAHTVLDGTVAEAYVDTGVKIYDDKKYSTNRTDKTRYD